MEGSWNYQPCRNGHPFPLRKADDCLDFLCKYCAVNLVKAIYQSAFSEKILKNFNFQQYFEEKHPSKAGRRYYDPNIHRKRFEVQPQPNNAPDQNANVAPQAQPQVQEEPENTADNAEPLEEPPNDNIQPENDVNLENDTENQTNQPLIEKQSFNFHQIKRGKFCNGKRYMRVEWLDKIRTWEPDSSFDPPMLEERNLS
ncbi:Hypothetical predicted protein [Mytilus galloprovincialis]|uniref:Uncharacterized protein n=1 Tax=Mytilus galloprovincialis TaxID=29158 RepID=A0A8B6EZH4_MYTGA|nr:Hypothetical predicted protein [Mytilus galloprovincialis]